MKYSTRTRSIYFCGGHFQVVCQFFHCPKVQKSVQTSTGKIQPNAELTFWPSIERIELKYWIWQCLRCEFCPSKRGLQIPLPTWFSRRAQWRQTLLPSRSLQIHLWNLLKSSRHVTSCNRLLSRSRDRTLGTRLAKTILAVTSPMVINLPTRGIFCFCGWQNWAWEL